MLLKAAAVAVANNLQERQRVQMANLQRASLPDPSIMSDNGEMALKLLFLGLSLFGGSDGSSGEKVCDAWSLIDGVRQCVHAVERR